LGADASGGFGPVAGLRYGALGFALAFVALPLYVTLPAHYAQQYGVPLALLGAVLLLARTLDALVDPWIGRRCDVWLNGAPGRLLGWMLVAALLLVGGFTALFFPPLRGSSALLAWCALWLVVTYLGYSLLSVLHQAWGARLGGDAVQQTRIVAWREGFALAGVICASILPALFGLAITAGVLALALVVGLALLRLVPRMRPPTHPPTHPRTQPPTQPRQLLPAAEPALAVWRVPAFRRLLAVYVLNGIAAAIPATLLLFFVRDRLQTPGLEGLYLGAYFAAAALSLPFWLRAVARLGQARAWSLGMLLALLAFGWAAALGAGDRIAFTLVCLASGAALGADLAIPGAMLSLVVQQAGLAGRAEGAFFGWWNAANKINLALAAGLALPLLQWLGYAPGQRSDAALQALTLAYCVLPCLLKLSAAALLYLFQIRPVAMETA
jgi:Na+/melibiose symporter-like transporter